MNQPQQDSNVGDRRTQTRIQVNIPIKVILPGTTEPVTAVNQDISWGGILFMMSGPPPKVAGIIRIILPWKRDERITADAHLVRVKPLPDGRYVIAARFFSLSPRSHARLERLLKMLQGNDHSSAALTHSSGLVRELEVTVNDAADLRQMLNQIATGRHTVTVFDAYEANQSIRLSISGTKVAPVIRLRARVVEVQKTHSKPDDWTDLYTLTLEFEHPRKSIRAFVDLFLNSLPETLRDYDSTLAAPDWINSSTLVSSTFANQMFAEPASAGRAQPPVRTVMLSALETAYPESLNHLSIGWGDVDAFESLFRDLILGDYGDPNGWPADAWEELEFLQNVHDLAYGMSKTRRSMLKGGRNI